MGVIRVPSKKPKGTASKVDVTMHVIREHCKKIIKLAAIDPKYDEEDSRCQADLNWLETLKARLPERELRKLNPLKGSKRS